MSRRNFLRGVGTCLALPAFGSLAPVRLASAAESPSAAPVRMAFMSIPNGVVQDQWWPEGQGRNFTLNKTMEPLSRLKNQLQVFAGLDQENADPGPDGAGDHARANATFLTGMRARKTSGADIRVGTSVDQLAAQELGHLTRFPSLELTCDAVRNTGSCDSGYACAYQFNLSWSSPTTPVSPEPNPRLVFERLFGTGEHGERHKSFELRKETQRSVLDFVLDEVSSLENRLGNSDRRKMDEYLSSVRQVEQQIQRTEAAGTILDPEMNTPDGIPGSFEEHMDIMYELTRLAFLSDSTRVVTLLLAHDGSNRTFPLLNINEGHHWLTHNLRDENMREKAARIEYSYVEHFAKFLTNMANTEDMDGNSLLHNSMLLYGGAIADGNRHSHQDCPCILAGSGGGRLTPGRYSWVKSQPMSNLFIGMLDRFGVKGVESFGDSNGRLDDI